MDWMIYFPHLGIQLEHVGKTINLFGFHIAYYGIIIGFGMLVGMYIAERQAKASNQDPNIYFDLALVGIIFSIIGARIYYVVFSWENFKDNPLQIFNLRGGGLAIYGGVIAAVITVFIFAKRRSLNPYVLLDTACPGLIAGQMIGRWGNFFNREAFGDYSNGVFAMQLPVSAVRKGEITKKMWDHLVSIDGVDFVQVHPTFLYESLWCLMGLLLLLWYQKKKKFDGEEFLMYLLIYALGRVWIEGLRTDQLVFKASGIPASQLLAGILVIICPIIIGLGRKKAAK